MLSPEFLKEEDAAYWAHTRIGAKRDREYGGVILPFTILRRLDAILAPTKDQVLAEYEKIQGLGVDPGIVLKNKFNLPFFNTSKLVPR